ncbi:MAG: AEC family transporter [Clostridia bacterium]|nr:AEC family transporter [Clostridia bacterium]
MGEVWIMLKNVIVFVLLAVPGYLLVKTKLLKQEHSGVLSKLLVYVGMPFLILSSMIEKVTISKDLFATIGLAVGVGIGFTLLMFFATIPLTAQERQDKTRGMMRFCSMFSNNGFLGIPLAAAVFSDRADVMTVLIIINILTNVLMYTLGVYLISRDRKTISLKKAFLNPVLIAFAIGIVLNLCDVQKYIPEVATYSGHFRNLVTPISMTILGMKMAGVKMLSLFTSWKTYYVSALKLVVFPVLIVGVLLATKAVFGGGLVSEDFILGAFVSFATPTAGLASTFSDTHNGDSRSAVAFTLGSTILSVATIPLLYWRLCFLF